MTDDLAAEILSALRTVAPEIDPARVDRRAPLTEQLDLDSMDYQRFLALLAAQYRLEIREVDVPGLATVEQIAAYVTARQSAAAT